MNEQISPTPAQVREVLRRVDVLAEAKKYGFVPIGAPDSNGWQPGVFPPPVNCGLLNIGRGPERGNFIECTFAGTGCLARCSSMN